MTTTMIYVALCLAICLISVNAGECGTSSNKCPGEEFWVCKRMAPPGFVIQCYKPSICHFTCRYTKGDIVYEVPQISRKGTPCEVNGRKGKCDGQGNCIRDRPAEASSQCV